MLQWMIAGTEQMKDEGARFLCRHAEELGVPYKWSTIMNSLYYSICDSGFMIALDRHGQIRGVWVYTYGDGEGGKPDETRMEVHHLFLEAGVRTGAAFVEALEALIERESELPLPIGEVHFYSIPTDARRRLFGKLASIRDTRMHPCGLLDSYVTTPDRVKQYIARLHSRK